MKTQFLAWMFSILLCYGSIISFQVQNITVEPNPNCPDIFINQGKSNYPLLSSSRSERSIRQQNGIKVEVANGQQLLVTGK